jgi:serine/threonine protein phosphatase PrpC
VDDGDFVLMFSDGYCDNVYDDKMLKVLNKHITASTEDLDECVSELGELAVRLSKDKSW